MIKRLSDRYSSLWTPFLLLLCAGLVVLLAPEERTLGSGIKVVYVHAALTWAGMISLVIAGLVGALIAVSDRRTFIRLMTLIGWVGFGLYLAGFAASVVAEQVNWGGVLWQESRTQATLNVIAIAVIVLVLGQFLASSRWRGTLQFLLIGVLAFSVQRAPSEMHPENAIGDSSSNSFRIVLYLLTGIFLLLGAWIVDWWRRRQEVD